MGISRLCYHGFIKVGSVRSFFFMTQGLFVVGYADIGKLRWHIAKRGGYLLLQREFTAHPLEGWNVPVKETGRTITSLSSPTVC